MAWLFVISSVAAAAIAFLIKVKQGQEHAVYVIGDLHGDVECAEFWVNKTNLIRHHKKYPKKDKAARKWKDGSSKLVFLGDYVDKGVTSKQVVQYVKSLTEQFPTHVTAIMGNHEIELLRDRSEASWGAGNTGVKAGYYQLGYSSVHPGEYLNYLNSSTASYSDEEDEIVIEALYNATIEAYSRGMYRNVFLIPEDDERILNYSILQFVPSHVRPLVKKRLKIYQAAYLDAYRSGTELGTWLEQRPVAAVVDKTLFVHGGLSPEVARTQLRTVQDVHRINKALAANAQEDKLGTFLRTTPEGAAVYNMLVYRGNHKKDDGEACDVLQAILPPGIDRLAVGHTPAATVRLQCANTFLAMDAALSRWFRNSGNEYCPGHRVAVSTNGRYQCRKKQESCQGQIVKIVGDQVHVIESSSS